MLLNIVIIAVGWLLSYRVFQCSLVFRVLLMLSKSLGVINKDRIAALTWLMPVIIGVRWPVISIIQVYSIGCDVSIILYIGCIGTWAYFSTNITRHLLLMSRRFSLLFCTCMRKILLSVLKNRLHIHCFGCLYSLLLFKFLCWN